MKRVKITDKETNYKYIKKKKKWPAQFHSCLHQLKPNQQDLQREVTIKELAVLTKTHGNQ